MSWKKTAVVACILFGLAGASGAATVKEDVNFRFGLPMYGADYDFDIDDDGTDDLRLSPYHHYSYGSSGGSRSSSLTVSGLNGAMVSLGGPLSEGDAVDGDLDFVATQSITGYSSWYSRSCSRWGGCNSSSGEKYFGEWTHGDTSPVSGFLGLALNGTLYGWAELDLAYTGSGTLLSFGFETESGTGILAGAETQQVATARSGISAVPLPGSGFLLIGGLSAMALRRRR